MYIAQEKAEMRGSIERHWVISDIQKTMYKMTNSGEQVINRV